MSELSPASMRIITLEKDPDIQPATYQVLDIIEFQLSTDPVKRRRQIMKKLCFYRDQAFQYNRKAERNPISAARELGKELDKSAPEMTEFTCDILPEYRVNVQYLPSA